MTALAPAAHRGLGAFQADASKLYDFLDEAYVALSAAERLVRSSHAFILDRVALNGVDVGSLEKQLKLLKESIGSSDSYNLREALFAAGQMYQSVYDEIKRDEHAS